MDFLQKLTQRYSEDGLTGVASSAPPYLKNRAIDALIAGISVDRHQLKECCHAEDRLWVYEQEDQFRIQPPLSDAAPPEFTQLVGTYTAPEAFVCEIHDAKLLGPRAICQTSSGWLVVEPMGFESYLEKRLRDTVETLGLTATLSQLFETVVTPPRQNYDYEHAAILSRRGGLNYGHWIIENLPKIKAVEHYTAQTSEEPLLILGPNPPDWVVEILELLGYTSDDWIEWGQDVATVRRLVVPSMNYIHSWKVMPCPAQKRWIRTRMQASVEDSDTDWPSRIYVSRQDVRRRSVKNYEQVMEVLRPLGFQSYRPERLSIEEQINLFSQADVIVGPFGAGLVNMIYATDATVIELLPPDYIGVCYYILANECGHTYDCVQSQPITSSAEARNRNLQVDPSKLETAVSNAIE